jgi:hypothetical protein
MLTQKYGWTHYFLVGFLLLAGAAQADDAVAQLDMAAGAGQLAWQQLQGSPASTDVDTLRLRWQALAAGGNPQQILTEAAALPSTAPADILHDADWLAARAALQAKDGRQARVYLGRLLWLMPVRPDEVRSLRDMVVQSHLLPQPDGDTEGLLLRDEQDYGANPALRLQVVAAFIQAKQKLPDMNAVRTGLADTDPVAVLLDVASGNLSGSDLRQRVGQLLQQPHLPDIVLQALQVLLNDRNEDGLQEQLDERMLAEVKPQGVDATALWKRYHSQTQSFANVRLLLFGSDTGWAEQAKQNDDPVMARAIWAYLARQAKDAQLRVTAQEHLIDALSALQEDRTVLRLFSAAWSGLPAQDFAPSVRWRLGQIGWNVGDDKLAAAMWQDEQILPAGGDRAAWLLERAQLFARVAQWPAAWQAFTGWQTVRAGGMLDWNVALLAESLSHHASSVQTAEQLLRDLLPVSTVDEQRFLFFRLGELESGSEPRQAAQWYLRAAGSKPDSTRDWRATARAAELLQRVGLHDDARHLAKNLVNHCPDAAIKAQVQQALLDNVAGQDDTGQ